ncbi:MAG: hypothetical protein AB7R55_24625 [Gemmatimonadales bacterium]
MLYRVTVILLGAFALGAAGGQQSAREILETMRARQLARWDTVANYTVFQKPTAVELPGLGEGRELEIPMHYQKHDIEGQPAFGLVPGNEYQVAVAQASEHGEYVTPEFFERGADAQRMTADAFDAELARSGMPKLPGMNYPGQMMRDNAVFMDASGQAVREAEAGDFGRANAAANLVAMAEMAERLELVGRERVDDRHAYHLRAEGLDRVVSEPGEEHRFTIRSVHLWVDAEQYVTLRTTMAGELEAEGQKREVTFEQHFQDYRQVGPLYESFRQVMRMTGLMGEMDPKDKKKMEEMQKQLAEFEAQRDKIPAAARGMVDRQMARAKAQMEMLTGDKGFEFVTEVTRIEINTGPPPPGSHR